MDILDINALLAQLTVAVGAALVAGNAFALYQERRGRRPQKAQGQLRKGRAVFLLLVGLLIAGWGIASLVT